MFTPDGQAVSTILAHPWALGGGMAGLKTAAVSGVGTIPEYRRLGLLRAQMQMLFQDCKEKGQAVATLAATQSAIYQRYGYVQCGECINVGRLRLCDCSVADSDRDRCHEQSTASSRTTSTASTSASSTATAAAAPSGARAQRQILLTRFCGLCMTASSRAERAASAMTRVVTTPQPIASS